MGVKSVKLLGDEFTDVNYITSVYSSNTKPTKPPTL